MFIIGEWAFDSASRRLLAGQEERRLSPKAADVLLALAETPGRVWSRDALLERVWPDVCVGEEVLTHAVSELRRALGDTVSERAYIETVHKRGYRLKCAVEHILLDGGPDEPAGNFDLHLYARYLDACDLFERGGTTNTTQAASLFESIVQQDPAFSPAQVGVAKARAFLGIYYCPKAADLNGALRHCEAAWKTDPRSADAFAAAGFVYAIGGDYKRALRNFGKAVGLAPRSCDVHYLLGRACFAELDVALAAPMLERAATLRSDDYHSLMLAGKARQMHGDAGAARKDFALAAARIGPRLVTHPEDFRALCGLARCLVHLDRLDEMSALLERVHDHSDPMSYHLACTYARAGDTRRALDTLELVVDHGWNHRAWLERDPDFDGLRQDRRFGRIAESIRH